MDELLSIGRFSRICWLSIKALRLYDETGLLHPAYVDPVSGYRYYTADQAPAARAIAILRSLDMPLAQIKAIVTESDPDQVRARLDEHRAALEERIDRDRHMLKRVETFIRKGAVMAYDITLQDIEPADVIGITFTTSPESINADMSRACQRAFGALETAGVRPLAAPQLAYLDMQDDAWTVQARIPVPPGSDVPDGLTGRRLDGGRAAVAVHVGPYDELGMAYREVEVWIDRNGLVTAGPPYDVYLNDPTEVKDPAKYQTKIVWPVRNP
ncbi:MerR family transcriptional regulator [Phytoactinopolyspora alkaliphila]|uniref:MerR family transcriptional regulator n=1 Tax=Phytoactinopolyspora alkaliphila TaxID=1783498 RepID=A0A6N9YGB1_9ACTN|nr:MerR family transcriptional regulator [Phytoactinopolyspora alkaliphila]NED93967.1 MerR family transcriptional regulator [Phytoactinopolyspora alkaliphila]